LVKKNIFNKRGKQFLGLKKLEENKNKREKKSEKMPMLFVSSLMKILLKLKRLRTFIIKNLESKPKKEELKKFVTQISKILRISSLMNKISTTCTSSTMTAVMLILLLKREHTGKDSRN